MENSYNDINNVDELYFTLAAILDSIDSVPPNSMVGAVIDKCLITKGLKACRNYEKQLTKGKAARRKYGDEH